MVFPDTQELHQCISYVSDSLLLQAKLFTYLNLSLCRYFYPFPVGPLLYQVELSIGGQQFHGKGRTRQAAKHDAAAKALKVLQNEPLPEKPEVGINLSVLSINC